MVRVSLKNTFLSFDEGADGEFQRIRESCSPRSRSAEAPMSPPRIPEDNTEFFPDDRLVDISLVLPPGVGSQGGSPRQVRTPRSRANSDQIPSPQETNNHNKIPREIGEVLPSDPRGMDPQTGLAVPSQSAASTGARSGRCSPTQEESNGTSPVANQLRQLQARLEEMYHPERRGSFRHVNSNGSISTMSNGCASESGEEGHDTKKRLLGASLMHKVWSSNSVSTLGEQSDFVEDEGLVEFNLHIEEETVPRPTWEREGCTREVRQVGSPTATNISLDKSINRQQQRSLPKEYRHGHVPKNLDLAEEYRKSADENPPTTLMIRNIPNRYTQRELIVELEDLGFAGTFDFLYVPLDKGTMSNVGYAFVNFVQPHHAQKCIQAFQGYKFKKHRKVSGKIAAVSIAHIQGLEANLAHYKNAAVNTAKMKQRRPLVMANISQSLLNAVGGNTVPEQGGSNEGYLSKLQEFHF